MNLVNAQKQNALAGITRLMFLFARAEMVEGLEYELNVDSRGDILRFLKKFEQLGRRVLTKDRYPAHNDCFNVYHIGNTTVVAHYCTESRSPRTWYLDIQVYGKPATKFRSWLERHKKPEEPEEPNPELS